MIHNPLYYNPFSPKLQEGLMKNMEFVGNTHRASPHHPSFDRIPHITMTGEGKQSAEQNRIEQNRTEQRTRRIYIGAAVNMLVV